MTKDSEDEDDVAAAAAAGRMEDKRRMTSACTSSQAHTEIHLKASLEQVWRDGAGAQITCSKKRPLFCSRFPQTLRKMRFLSFSFLRQ